VYHSYLYTTQYGRKYVWQLFEHLKWSVIGVLGEICWLVDTYISWPFIAMAMIFVGGTEFGCI